MDERVKCSHCTQSFNSAYHLKKHHREQHQLVATLKHSGVMVLPLIFLPKVEFYVRREDGQAFICPSCKDGYINPVTLQKHYASCKITCDKIVYNTSR